jgi:hypothetical protein
MLRTIVKALGVLIALAWMTTLSGCAGTLVLPETRPADYSMLVTVYPGAERAPGGGRAFRAARYAVETDGLLRAEAGAGVVEPGFPPIARRLEPAQLDALYALARDAGIQEAPRVPGPTVYRAPEGRPVAVIELGSGGTYRAHEVAATPGSSAAPLIRELARLSWLESDTASGRPAAVRDTATRFLHVQPRHDQRPKIMEKAAPSPWHPELVDDMTGVTARGNDAQQCGSGRP